MDQFVASLKDKVITLSRRPAANTYTTVDFQDEWVTWIGNLGYCSIFSHVVDPTQGPDKALQCFQFSIENTMGQAIFDSSSTDLETAFGKEPAATVQPPCVVVRATGPVLYCGLVKPALALKPTVEQIFEYAGLGTAVINLPLWHPRIDWYP